MKNKIGTLARAVWLGGVGLCIAAMPAGATPLWDVQLYSSSSSIFGGGNYGGIVTYDSTTGVTRNPSSNDPSFSYTYAPNPAASGVYSNLTLSTLGTAVGGYENASLATGQTHLSAGSTYTAPGVTPSLETSEYQTIQMSDVLTFTGSGTVTFGFALDGSVSFLGIPPGMGYDPSSYSQTVGLSLTGSSGDAYMEWGGTANGAANAGVGPTYTTNTSGTLGWNNGAGAGVYSNDTYNGFLFSGTLTVHSGEVLDIALNQGMNCNYGASCSFQNTGQLSLILAQGVSYTSASGVFLTQTNSTPEPGTWVLLGAGMSAFILLRRRTRRI